MHDTKTTAVTNSNEELQAELVTPAPQTQAAWWNRDDFPFSAPCWFRYPASLGVSAASYWCFFVWEKKIGWIGGVMLAIIALGLARELLLGAVIAALAGLALWAAGAAFAALPVSVAIIIGAMIIAQAMRR